MSEFSDRQVDRNFQAVNAHFKLERARVDNVVRDQHNMNVAITALQEENRELKAQLVTLLQRFVGTGPTAGE